MSISEKSIPFATAIEWDATFARLKIMTNQKIRLSHTALDTFLTCERKFQLDRLLAGGPEKQDYPATVLGKSFGAGVASYLQFQDQEKALYDAWLAYYPILEDDKRTQEIACNLMMASFPKLDDLLLHYELAYFNEKPAVELSFRLNINEQFYYVGYVDIVLKDRYTGKYVIMENKTTSLNLFDLSCVYGNSGQALGYSIVLDEIAGEDQADYDVLYFVAQLGSGNGFTPKVQPLHFPKTLADRFNWFISLGMDVERMQKMLDCNVFPLRGSSCLQYMRPCYHFGTCNLHGLDEYKDIPEDLIEYQFVYELDNVVENHLNRLKG